MKNLLFFDWGHEWYPNRLTTYLFDCGSGNKPTHLCTNGRIARNIYQDLFDRADPDPIFYQVNPIDHIILPGAITTPKEVHILLPLHML